MTKAKNGNVQVKPNFSIASVGEDLADKGFEQIGCKGSSATFSKGARSIVTTSNSR